MSIDPPLAVELGPVRVIVVTAIVTAVVTSVVGAVVVWLKGAAGKRFAARREERHADHTVITSGWSYSEVAGTSTEFFACVRAAPSKSLPARVRLDAGRIALLVRSAFGDLFPSEPEVSVPTDRVRYEAKDPGRAGATPYVQVWSTGLIEATVPITHTVTTSGDLLIPLVEIARVLLPAIRAIQHGGYEEAFGPAAVISMGLDWEMKMSRELVGTTSIPWDALEFPGRAPAGRATDQGPPWPRPGFGHDDLLCMATTTAPEDILMPAFADLVEQSGYYGAEDALSDLRTAIRKLTYETTAPGTAAALDVEAPEGGGTDAAGMP